MSRSSKSKSERRHAPLEDDLGSTGLLRNKAPKRKHADESTEDKFVDSKASKKILRLGQELAEEDVDSGSIAQLRSTFDFESRFADDDNEGPGSDEDEDKKWEQEDGGWGDADEEVEEVEVDPQDLEAYTKFFPQAQGEDGMGGLGEALSRQGWGGTNEEAAERGADRGTDLTALILEKIAAHEAAQSAGGIAFGQSALQEDEYELPEKVVEVYTKVGLLLSRYKSGKLPKPFKILPTVPRWEDIIQITRPEKWSANACYEATKIFVSGTPIVAQRFMEMIILDRVREDIHETKKLNVHLFKALKKGLYKPAAFFKGFLFPLVGSGTCTLREAHIISGVLVRVSIPVLHSAAALKGLCDIAAQEASAGTEGGGATNIFIKALLEKKYALPFQVIDALVFHFLRFRTMDPADSEHSMNGVVGGRDARDAKLPVIWHQSLLAFAQRYRNDITEDQREALLDLLLNKGHSAIGPEVRKELLAGRGRGVALEPEGPTMDGDDTMLVD